VAAIVAALSGFFARDRWRNRVEVLVFLGFLAVSLCAILPVSAPLYGTIRVPDPWYRIVFLLNTIIIASGAYLIVRCATQRVQVALAIVALAIVLRGSEKTRQLWIEMTTSAERERKFYLNNPDKILLSEQAAPWFIAGVHLMYRVRIPHYVHIKDLQKNPVREGIPVWRFRDGRFVPDYTSLNPPVRP
jgi:hypothetical protein